jgi:hypothetical protein
MEQKVGLAQAVFFFFFLLNILHSECFAGYQHTEKRLGPVDFKA